MFAILVKIIEENLVVKVLLKDLKAIDYYKRVSQQEIPRLANSRSMTGINLFDAFNGSGGRVSAQSRSGGGGPIKWD